MFTLQQIFQKHSGKGNLSLAQLKAFRSIKRCRTESLGSRLHHCLDCGHSVVLHNSCRNRHCPQCQTDKQRKWVGYREMNGKYVLQDWGGINKGYKEFNGIRIPSNCDIFWKEKTGDFNWYKCEIIEIEYNKPMMF